MKKAFTMLELIMVIVIIGILAAVIMPRTASNDTAEAAVKLISDIRYTQHLAMVDDKFGATDANWYKKIWQIRFSGNTYSIVSDNNATFAKNPIDKNKEIKNIELDGVAIDATNCNSIIGFDHIGRPITGDLTVAGTSPYSNLMTANCVIQLSDGSTDINITIRPETGYASLP